MFLRNITIFLENIKVFFAAWECVKTKPRPYEPKDSIVHVLTHPPVCKVCTYASGYTYGGIRPHVGSVVILGGLTFVNFPLCIHLC